MKQPPSPNTNCTYCGQNWWDWNKLYKTWQCHHCALKGRPEPLIPDIDTTVRHIYQWEKEIYADWDKASAALKEANASEELNSKTSKRIMAQARVRKAQSDYKTASTRAEIATFIGFLATAAPTGDIYLDIPLLNFKERITWSE